VTLLAGNVVTAAMVAACLNTIDATALRRLHPAIAAAVAAVPWADTTTAVCDIERWRAALPAAVGCMLSDDADVAHLPPTLRSLDLSSCEWLTRLASLAHLPALEVLECSNMSVGMTGVACLPPSLREMRMNFCTVRSAADFSHLRALRVLLDIGCHSSSEVFKWPPGGSLAHLTCLRVLRVTRTRMDASAMATFPPSLHNLNLGYCKLTPTTSFSHLHCLRALNARHSELDDAALATLPPSLVSLDLECAGFDGRLTSAAAFPHLPALRVLNVCKTEIGDAIVASMAPGLEQLRMVNCRNVTQRASMDHLTALRVLHSSGTDLSPATIASCRARGCTAPADSLITNANEGGYLLVALPDGRLVSGVPSCSVALWTATHRGPPLASARVKDPLEARALAVLPDGYRVAIAVSGKRTVHSGIFVWDTRGAPHAAQMITAATIDFGDDLEPTALTVLRDGRLAAGSTDGALRIVDVDAGAVMAVLRGHFSHVTALAVLPDGRLASGSHDMTVRVWDVDAGMCVAKLIGHANSVTSLVALPGGRLASGSWDNTVRLWDVGHGSSTCIGMLDGQRTRALVVLPGSNRLVSLLDIDKLLVWDTHDTTGVPLLRLQQTVDLVGSTIMAIVALPDGRLATAGSGVRLWQLPFDAAPEPR